MGMANVVTGYMADRMKQLHADGWGLQKIADKFGVNTTTVWRHVNGITGRANTLPKAKRKKPRPYKAAAPKGLNGLTSAWAKAEALERKAQAIKAAVKTLHAAMH